MRVWTLTLAALALVAVSPVQARDLRPKDLQMCQWGAETARNAQQSKLSGVTLWTARHRVQVRHYAQPWMHKMALGITDQTYHSKSRLRPLAVKKAYYDGCIKHELARR
ncbi:hypothetical protein [Pseudomonas sp. dw_358]|uniref:hypothetical protein n=1 Tax=Pseudomonas sp. dw_358 TaxID=2720083 RepID=UPI001BD27B3A|nr:hypothetical protein [Pseudomonas sp. dw_358]